MDNITVPEIIMAIIIAVENLFLLIKKLIKKGE